MYITHVSSPKALKLSPRGYLRPETRSRDDPQSRRELVWWVWGNKKAPVMFNGRRLWGKESVLVNYSGMLATNFTATSISIPCAT